MIKFPWTNFHELNLDWILSEIKKLGESIESILTKIGLIDAHLEGLDDETESLDTRLTSAEGSVTDLDERVEYLEDNPYVLPQADGERLGGVKAPARDPDIETLPVKIDEETGMLYYRSVVGDFVEIDGQTVNEEGYFAYKSGSAQGDHFVQMTELGCLTLGSYGESSVGAGFDMYRHGWETQSGLDMDELTFDTTNGILLRATLDADDDDTDDSPIMYNMTLDENYPNELATRSYVDSHAGGGTLYINRIELRHTDIDHGKFHIMILARNHITEPSTALAVMMFMVQNNRHTVAAFGSIDSEPLSQVAVVAAQGELSLVAYSSTNTVDITDCDVVSYGYDTIA